MSTKFRVVEADLRLSVDQATLKVRSDGDRLRIDLGHWRDVAHVWPMRKRLFGGARHLRNAGIGGKVFLRGFPIYRWSAGNG